MKAPLLAKCGIFLGCAPLSPATVAEFQAAAAAEPSLLHQWSFDGETDLDRQADQKGGANLTPRQSAAPTQPLVFGEPGYDESSDSVAIGRGPGADFADYAHLHADAISLGASMSFEAIVKPRQESITGGLFDLGYIISARVENDRGYFLLLGDGNLPSPTHPFSTTLGDGYNVANTNIFSPSPLVIDHWYYAAGSCTINPDSTVTWTNYVADLTAGEVLGATGPFTNGGGAYPQVPTPIGIGGRWDAGESFPGHIDEINLYDEALPAAYFEAQLELLVGDLPPFEIIEVTYEQGIGTSLTWNSLPGAVYQVDESADLEVWIDYNDNVPSQGTTTVETDPRPKPESGRRFYRVKRLQQ